MVDCGADAAGTVAQRGPTGVSGAGNCLLGPIDPARIMLDGLPPKNESNESFPQREINNNSCRSYNPLIFMRSRPSPARRRFSLTCRATRTGSSSRTGASLPSTSRHHLPLQRLSPSPNALGRFRAPARSQVAAVRHDLFCTVRGLLDHEAPAFFFRSVSVSHAVQGRPRQVAPPQRTPSAKPRTVHVRPAPAQSVEPPLSADARS